MLHKKCMLKNETDFNDNNKEVMIMAGITTNYSYSNGNCFNAVDKLKGTILEGVGQSSEGNGLHGGEMVAHMNRYHPEKYEEYSRLKKQCEEEFWAKTPEERLNDAQNGVRSAAAEFLEAYSDEQWHSNMNYISEARQAYQDEVGAWTEEDVDYMIKHAEEAERRLRSTNAASLSVSKDNLDYLCSEDGFAKMKKDAEDLYAANRRQQQKLAKGRDPSDKFWQNTGDQWITFSLALEMNGFYDSMGSEQAKEFQGMLEMVTSSMDNLSKSIYNTGIDFGSYNAGGKYFMSSAEAATALEASTAALQYISDKLIPDEYKDEFNGLIDMYKKHNEEILSEYQSPMESFNKVVAGIQKAGASFISKKPVADYRYTGMLGEVDKTESDKNEYRSKVADIFAKYAGKSDLKTIMDMLKAQYEEYATDDSDDEGFRQYVSKEAGYLFDNIEKYWGVLLEK